MPLALKLDCIHIARLIPGTPPGRERVVTHAVWLDGEPADDFSYDLSGTPCRAVVQANLCILAARTSAVYEQRDAMAQLHGECPAYHSK